MCCEGEAELVETPEDYEPEYWEYYKVCSQHRVSLVLSEVTDLEHVLNLKLGITACACHNHPCHQEASAAVLTFKTAVFASGGFCWFYEYSVCSIQTTDILSAIWT